jgi:hypothetical protein
LVLVKRRIGMFLGVLAIVGATAAAVIAFNSQSGRAQAASVRIRRVSTNGTLGGVSASELAKVGIALATTTTTPTVSVAQAEQAATAVYSDAILGVSLADCTIAGVNHGACYAVSLTPPGEQVKVCPQGLVQPGQSSPPTGCELIPAYTFEVVLVGATDGSVLTGVQSNT